MSTITATPVVAAAAPAPAASSSSSVERKEAVEEISNTKSEIIAKVEAFVKKELAGNDGSHDWFHIHRVRNLAVSLGKEEGLSLSSLEIVELAALLHDIKDWKYSGSETAGADAARAFLLELHYPLPQVEMITKIVAGIGFKTELGKSVDMFPELAVVQDADRLDAIGAIGIARTFTYGGSRNRALYDPAQAPSSEPISKTAYMNTASPTINHFYDKLLKLSAMMKTKSGAKRAASRHEYMQTFLTQFYSEWNATD